MKATLRAAVPAAIAVWAAVLVAVAFAAAGESRALAFMTLFSPHIHW